MSIPKKEKMAAKAALEAGNFSTFVDDAVSAALKERINAPNAGKSKAFAAWAQANAADHLVKETFIPPEYAVACVVQDANGETGFVAYEPIQYMLARPSVFKFIQYNQGSDKFEFVANERWIDPKWLTASEGILRGCKKYLGL